MVVAVVVFFNIFSRLLLVDDAGMHVVVVHCSCWPRMMFTLQYKNIQPHLSLVLNVTRSSCILAVVLSLASLSLLCFPFVPSLFPSLSLSLSLFSLIVVTMMS